MTQQQEIISYLSTFITERRHQAIDRVLENRTRYITIALEDIYQSQNASAVLRTCECFGIQDVHIIENKNEYSLNPDVVIGASKWLDLHRYNDKEYNTPECIDRLKKEGYRIIATLPDENSTPLEDFDIGKGKTAIFFGTELTGLSPAMIRRADEFLYIPIQGFTESFNISVSAAIILHYLADRIRQSDLGWELSGKEMDELKLQWLMKDVKHSGSLIKKYLSERK